MVPCRAVTLRGRCTTGLQRRRSRRHRSVPITAANEAVLARLLKIRGMVQGVAYRASMQAEAERIGVRGWVRNRRDGSVEAWVQGTAAQLDELKQWCWRGPRSASVQSIEQRDVAVEPTRTAFGIMPTED